MIQSRSATKRQLLKTGLLIMGSSLLAQRGKGGVTAAQSLGTPASSKFLISATLKPTIIADLPRHNVRSLRDAIADSAGKLRGTLDQFFLAGGTWHVTLMVSLPGPASASLVYALLKSGYFDDIVLSRIVSARDLDGTFKSMGGAASWPQ